MSRAAALALALFAAAATAAPAAAQLIAIVNGRIATGAAGEAPIERGTVLIKDGRILAVGGALAVPAGTRVLDAGGNWVTPGIFAGFSRLGLVEVDAVEETADADADTAPYQAAIDIAPGINPRSVNLAINRIEGLTRAVVAPAAGRDIFVGQGAIIATGEGGDTITRARAFQYIELGERGARLAGGSRPAAFLALRTALIEARDLAARPPARTGPARDSRLERVDLEALGAVVRGSQLALVHVERAQDILNLLALRREFPALRLVLVGAAEGHLVARQIATAGVPVIATALPNLPDRFETLAATQSNVGRLVAAGVTVALGQIDDNEARQVRLLPQEAGNLVALGRVPGATGLSHAQALASITRAPAEIFGLADQLGTLAPGRIADVVVWDGDPLELASAPVAVFIEGRAQPLSSRQTKLRDRYLGLQRGDATLHYRHPQP